MSFVGTRPEAVRYVEKYKPEYYASHLCNSILYSTINSRFL